MCLSPGSHCLVKLIKVRLSARQVTGMARPGRGVLALCFSPADGISEAGRQNPPSRTGQGGPGHHGAAFVPLLPAPPSCSWDPDGDG